MDNTIGINQVIAQMRALAAQAQSAPEAAAQPQQGGFAELLTKAIDQVNDTQKQAAGLAEAFERGDPSVNLPQVMIALQKSSVSFQAMTQVRNKLVEAYKEIMSMQM